MPRRLLLIWLGCCGLFAAEHIESLYPGKGLTVKARELPNDVEFIVDSPNEASLAIQVDRNHNGKVDAKVDVVYSKTSDGKACVMHLLGVGRHAISPCGGFVSAAKLKPDTAKGKTGYTLTVPKKELSLTGDKVSLTFWVIAREGREGKELRHLYYPSEFFEKPVEFKFTQK